MSLIVCALLELDCGRELYFLHEVILVVCLDHAGPDILDGWIGLNRGGWGLKSSLLVAVWVPLPTSQLWINVRSCHLLVVVGKDVGGFLFDICHLVGCLLCCCWGLDHLVLGPALSPEELSSALRRDQI